MEQRANAERKKERECRGGKEDESDSDDNPTLIKARILSLSGFAHRTVCAHASILFCIPSTMSSIHGIQSADPSSLHAPERLVPLTRPGHRFSLLDVSEILHLIGEQFVSWQTLTQCLLVSRSWYATFLPLLWVDIKIFPEKDSPPFRVVEKACVAHPQGGLCSRTRAPMDAFDLHPAKPLARDILRKTR